MKINVYCNNYFMQYNKAQVNPDSIVNLRTGFIRGIANKDDIFILRGEPTLHYDFNHILNSFTENNYILTTHGNNADAIINYDRRIPYVSFNWDGFLNDNIKGHRPLTSEILRTLQYLRGKNTIVRIAYTISPFNIKWLATDAVILRKMMDMFPNMKQPYFMLYQEGTYYSQPDFAWTSITKEDLNSLNKIGLLTKKNFDYLLAWINHKEYQCIAPQNDVTVMNDATVRMCQSYHMNKIIGDLNKNNLQEIIASSEEERNKMINCEYKDKCWFACHLKDSINDSSE